MTALPETEIMTLKKLEFALKKGDFKILRDGTYKLHEKYHSGFKFEYIDLLKDILNEVQDSNAPQEIKGILIPTIEDILSENYNSNSATSPFEDENRVSTLTSLSYTHDENNKPSEKINAFEAFGGGKVENPALQQNEQKPYQEFVSPAVVNIGAEAKPINNTIAQQETILPNENIKSKTKNIAIFFGQAGSNEKNKNILRYRELISRIDIEQVNFMEIINLISLINTQFSANIMELTTIFEQLQNKNVNINLITNSANSNIIALAENIKIPYNINSDKEKINIIPLFGLSNLFKCTHCGEIYLDIKEQINPYVLECPKCKKPMLPDYYCSDSKTNYDYYNNAMISFANADTWLLYNISGIEEVNFEIMKSALKLSKTVKNIYIQDKDINAKEIFKNAFYSANNEVSVNINIAVIEEFLKAI